MHHKGILIDHEACGFSNRIAELLPGCSVKRQLPEVQLGTLIRTLSIDRLLLHGKFEQIVSIGCGFDTRSSRLSLQNFYELDLENVTSIKGTGIPFDICSDCYILKQFDGNLRTVILFECVLMYIDPIESERLFSIIRSHFNDLTFIVFDVVLESESRFPTTMLRCLEMSLERVLKSLTTYKTIEDQVKRIGLPYNSFKKLRDLESFFSQELSFIKWVKSTDTPERKIFPTDTPRPKKWTLTYLLNKLCPKTPLFINFGQLHPKAVN